MNGFGEQGFDFMAENRINAQSPFALLKQMSVQMTSQIRYVSSLVALIWDSDLRPRPKTRDEKIPFRNLTEEVCKNCKP